MDVIIVGAGPVGLMLAHWILTSGGRVIMFEGRSFSRGQVLYILREFYDTIPEQVKARLDKEGICRTNKSPLVCLKNGKWFNIHISLFQQYMLDYLSSSQSFTFVPQFATAEDLKSQTFTDIVIIADGGGRRSIIRNLVDKPYRSIHVANSAVITYEGVLDSNKDTQKDFEKLHENQHAFIIHRALPNYGHIGMQLSNETYQQLVELPEDQQLRVFFKTPEGQVVAKVLTGAGYKQITQCIIGVFPIDLRSAKQFYYRLDGKHYFLVGDAAFTTHYFTGSGFNRGLSCAQYLLSMLQKKSPKKWSRYTKKVFHVRDKLWDDLVPSHLVDMSSIIKECRKSGEVAKFIIVKSRTQKDKNAIYRLRKRRFVSEKNGSQTN